MAADGRRLSRRCRAVSPPRRPAALAGAAGLALLLVGCSSQAAEPPGIAVRSDPGAAAQSPGSRTGGEAGDPAGATATAPAAADGQGAGADAADADADGAASGSGGSDGSGGPGGSGSDPGSGSAPGAGNPGQQGTAGSGSSVPPESAPPVPPVPPQPPGLDLGREGAVATSWYDDSDNPIVSSPSGDVVCATTARSARCDVLQGVDFRIPQDSAQPCRYDWGGGSSRGASVVLGALMLPRPACVGDALDHPPVQPTRLDYGHRIVIGSIMCTSERAGMRCESATQASGFRVGRSSVQFYCERPDGSVALGAQSATPCEGLARGA